MTQTSRSRLEEAMKAVEEEFKTYDASGACCLLYDAIKEFLNSVSDTDGEPLGL